MSEKYNDLKIYYKFEEISEIMKKYVDKDVKVFALKFNFPNSSIKDIPANNIIKNSMLKGLKPGDVIFDVSSGNFGIALAKLGRMYNFKVVIFSSRKLKENVKKSLEKNGAIVVQIYPNNPSKDIQNNINEQIMKIKEVIKKLNLDVKIIENHKEELNEFLKEKDLVNLTKYLAKIYNCFSTTQYENEMNPLAHYNYTARILEQNLLKYKIDPSNVKIVCAFGTGGTSLGLSKYFIEKYSQKNVIVAFPMEGQDVGGIRTLSSAESLPFFKAENYDRIEIVDFDEAKKFMEIFKQNGESIGESSAVNLQCVINLVKKGYHDKFVVIFADDGEKYKND